MNYLRLIIALIGLFLISACTLNSNGTYLVYNIDNSKVVDDQLGNDSDIRTYLQSKLVGTKYVIEFHDQYVTMKSAMHKDLVLAEGADKHGRLVYKQDLTAGTTSYRFRLMPDGNGLLFAITMMPPRDGSPFLPAQIGGITVQREGTVTCLLSRSDD